MEVTICPECGGSAEGIQPACPACGWPKPDHITNLQDGEIIQSCGHCRAIHRLGRDDNPALTHHEFVRNVRGVDTYLPLTTWNTVFLCAACHQWNWVTLDERITSGEFPCPECGAHTHVPGLGRHFGLARDFLKPVVLGEWRAAGKHLSLKCGHALYLPRVLLESQPRPARAPKPETEAPAVADPSTPAPQPASLSASSPKKTQPIPLDPPPE